MRAGRLPIGADTSVFDGSMAARIESELNLLLINDGLDPLPLDLTHDTRERRRLFVAIARGVLGHLRDNLADVDVSLPQAPDLPTIVSPTMSLPDVP